MALLWSGQTRTYDYTVWDSMLNLYSDYDIDHYGHTWDYCEDPFNVDQFISYKRTAQIEIDEWLERNPQYKQNFDNYTEQHVYGQVWGFLECIKQLQPNDYDLIVRTRWDTKAPYGIGDLSYREYQDRISSVLNKYSEYKIIFGSEVLVGEKAVMSRKLPYVGDIHFILVRKYPNLINEKVEQFINNVQTLGIPKVLNTWQRQRDEYTLCLNHSLWVDFLLWQDFSLYACLPGHNWSLKR